jgi:hypothetical protein
MHVMFLTFCETDFVVPQRHLCANRGIDPSVPNIVCMWCEATSGSAAVDGASIRSRPVAKRPLSQPPP